MNGSVRRRSNGNWEYRFDLGPDPLTGRRSIRSKSGFATKKEASQALRNAVTAHERGRSVKTSSRTVESFLTEWHDAVRARHSTHDVGELPRLHERLRHPRDR